MGRESRGDTSSHDGVSVFRGEIHWLEEQLWLLTKLTNLYTVAVACISIGGFKIAFAGCYWTKSRKRAVLSYELKFFG